MVVTDSSGSTLQVMKALVEVGPEGATRDRLLQKAGISYASFYRAVQPLLQDGLVTVHDGRYVMSLDNLHNYRFKLWHDTERLYRLAPPDRDQALDVAAQARAALGDNLRCLWLVGSATQAALQEKSDLDFLAVVGKDRLYHPTGSRPTQFVIFTEAVFRGKYHEADAFVAAALRQGIVLVDRDFAQDYYARPLPVGPSAARPADLQKSLEAQRDQFLFFLQKKELEPAQKALQAVAVATARFLLDLLGESPADKTDLLERCAVLFGPRLADTLKDALRSDRLDAAAMGRLNRRLSDYHQAAIRHQSHLRSFASLPAANGRAFENLASQVLQELLPEAALHREQPVGPVTFGLTLTCDDGQYLVAFKAPLRELTAAHVRQFAAAAKRARRPTVHPVLIVNPFRTIPAGERAPLPAAVVAQSQELGVRIISAVDLLRAHNERHLEELDPVQSARVLLRGPAA